MLVIPLTHKEGVLFKKYVFNAGFFRVINSVMLSAAKQKVNLVET